MKGPKYSFFNKIYSYILTIALLTTFINISKITVNATQSKSDNFNKSFSLTGNYRNDIVAVANAQYLKTKSQLGYTEGWCADFVCDCAKLAQLPNFPFYGGVDGLKTKLITWGGTWYSSSSGYSPQKGDIVFLSTFPSYSSTKGLDHVGIVTSNGFNSNGTVNTIEGNTSSSSTTEMCVNKKTRKPMPSASSSSTTMYVVGYVSLNLNTTSHTHNYNKYVYRWDAHPHYNCYQCSCGQIEANTSEPVYVDSCNICNHVHNYNTYIYRWDAHPHYNCYQCSCGQIEANTSEPVYVDSCNICNHVHNYNTYIYRWDAHPHYNCYQCSCGQIEANTSEPYFESSCSECIKNINYGDINHDGNVTAADALIVLRYVVGKEPYLSMNDLLAANVCNRDGIDAVDALMILQYSVGKIQQLPVN